MKALNNVTKEETL